MKATKKLFVSAVVLAAALLIQVTTFAAGSQNSLSPSSNPTISTTPHMDGTEPMPLFPG